MRFLVLRLTALLLIVCAPALVGAQQLDGRAAAPDVQYDAPPHLSLLDGEVDVVRAGRREAAAIGQVLESGDRLDVRAGRAEILFGDGSALHLDVNTTIDVLDDGLLRMPGGRAYLHVSDGPDRFEYRLDTPAASVYTDTPGEYRVAVDGERTPVLELAVARGLASATTAADSVAVRGGEMIRVRAGDRPGRAVAFNVAYWDDFGRWSYERRYGPVDAQTRDLPAPIVSYASTFTQYGHWASHATHGRVWYPRVAHGWRPFYHGHWRSVAPYGWTWAGIDPWTWPTHHYGTWGVTAVGGWFWIPGAYWRPAPVHWTITAGHVGWVPWGYGSVGAYGFTVVPRGAFAVNVFVPRHAVHVHPVRPVVRDVFVAYPPPVPDGTQTHRAFAVPRRPVPSRAAVPRTLPVPGAPADQRPVVQVPSAAGPVDSPRSSAAGTARPERMAVGRQPVPYAEPSALVNAPVMPPSIGSRPDADHAGTGHRSAFRRAAPVRADPRVIAPAPSTAPAPAPAPATPAGGIDRGGARPADDSGFRAARRPATTSNPPPPAPPSPERGGGRVAVLRGAPDQGGESSAAAGRNRGDGGEQRGGGRRR
jgi:hypothetical protein